MTYITLIGPLRVAAVVVTYGSRIGLLQQTVRAILEDEHVVKLFIVDNDSDTKDEVAHLAEHYGERVQVIWHEKNLGSAGGFAAGIRAARSEEVDYIYLSDDDVIISKHFVSTFSASHVALGNSKVVLCARRASFWAGTDVHYKPVVEVLPRRYFNVIHPRIILVFLKSVLGIKDKHIKHESFRFFPIIPAHGWAYAGVLLPVEAAQQAPLPDHTLGLYLDDIAYAWGVIDTGYPSFALMEPHLEDLEMTHTGSHTATGLFSPTVSSTKIYYETRNRVRVSLTYGKASLALLSIQVAIWYVGICILGILRTGVHASTFKRMLLIKEALRAGFDSTRPVPEGLAVRI
jgi:glycosyltransferase involved in cell wall biosynthesis